ncbi:MAG: hypothetical protein U9P42_00200 [Candidatus Fermentibacteria bacterium]|nr:hypothetical protein [Candidatus Fermentibacteria bacterium]
MVTLLLATLLASQPVFLASDINDYVKSLVALRDGRVLFVDNDSNFWTVSCDSQEKKEEWLSFWDYSADGWVDVIRVSWLSGSWDGERVCYAVTVTAGEGVHAPEMVLVCNSDGSNAEPVALSFDVGSGPQFDFTMDSRFLYGSPVLSCSPDHEGFIGRGTGSGVLPPADMIEIATGERSNHGSILSDGYYPCPFSDIVSGASYPPSVIYDMNSSEVLFEVSDHESPVIDKWVLPDAGLVTRGDNQFLRYADGTEISNPNGKITVYTVLGDGRYIYSPDDGDTVFLAEINWDSFKELNSIEQPGLAGILSRRGTFAVQGDVLYFLRSDSLFCYSILTD